MNRSLRIITGLLLYIFIACHLLNVSLGIVSAELVEQTRPYFMYIWSSRIGGIVLLAALLFHGILGLYALYQRNTLQMSLSDSLQFAAGFLILPLMIPHVWGVIAMLNILELTPTYPGLMQLFWIDNPLEGLRQVLLVAIVWIHGSIGIFTWLQLKPWWPRIALFVYPLIVLIPVTALLGFVEGGNLAIKNYENSIVESQTTDNSDPYGTSNSDPYGTANSDPYAAPAADESDDAAAKIFANNYAFIIQVKWIMITVYLGILAMVLVARRVRLARQSGLVRVTYDNGTTIKAVVGKSFLELSQTNNIPHANLCRGRGRCGTCRIRIGNATGSLPEPTQMEIDALHVTESEADMRLACQCIPGAGDFHIERVFEPDVAYSEFRKGGKRQRKTELSEDTAIAGGIAE